MSHLALSVGVMTESVGTELCKSYTNKNRRYCVHCSSEISSDFRVKARGKILTCTSRHVARAKSDYSSNFRFRTKIRDEKSLENTKQFSAQHNQSTCHVMSTKHEIKMSWRDKFRTAFVVFWSELRCVWQNNILNYSKRRIRANIWKVHVTERPKNSGKRITEGKSSQSALIIVRVTPYRKLSSSPSQVWVTSQVRFNLNRSLFFSLLVFFLFFCFDFCVKMMYQGYKNT